MQILKSKPLKFLAIASIVGILGSFTATSANAGNIGVDLYLGNGSGIYYSTNRNHNHHRKIHNPGHYNPYNQPRRHYRKKQRRNKYRHRNRQQVCGPRRAVNKAYRLGLDGAQVHRVKERRIVVTGYQYGYRTKMVFKRYSNCHLLKTVNFNW